MRIFYQPNWDLCHVVLARQWVGDWFFCFIVFGYLLPGLLLCTRNIGFDYLPPQSVTRGRRVLFWGMTRDGGLSVWLWVHHPKSFNLHKVKNEMLNVSQQSLCCPFTFLTLKGQIQACKIMKMPRHFWP